MPAKKPARPAPITLRRWREHRDLTLEQVADRIGVGPQAVHKWETGKTPVEIETLKLLAEVYGTSPDALLFDPLEEEMAWRLKRAHAILKAIPPDRAEQWLGVGAAMTTPTTPNTAPNYPPSPPRQEVLAAPRRRGRPRRGTEEKQNRANDTSA